MSFLDTLLGRKHPPMIGLDISSSSVKLVELGQTASGEYVLERFGVESFEKGWITDGQIEKFDEVAEAVKAAEAEWADSIATVRRWSFSVRPPPRSSSPWAARTSR